MIRLKGKDEWLRRLIALRVDPVNPKRVTVRFYGQYIHIKHDTHNETETHYIAKDFKHIEEVFK